MTEPASPRVAVEIYATRKLYLSDHPRFSLTLLLTLRNSHEPVVFLKSGLRSVKGLQSINSDQIIQCIDVDSGEDIQILRDVMRPSFLVLQPDRRYFAAFTNAADAKEYELPFDTSSLQAGKKYEIRCTPVTQIAHWPSGTEAILNSLTEDSLQAADIPNPSTTRISWDVVGEDAVTFETLQEQPRAPQVKAFLSAPSEYSLSRNPPYTFALTFSTDAPSPITVFTRRQDVCSMSFDVEICSTDNLTLGPELIDINYDDPSQRDEFLRLDKTYKEEREIDHTKFVWLNFGDSLKVGEEYVLRHRGERWSWWSEASVDEVVQYANSRMGLGSSQGIEIASAGKQKFVVVE
ncbi:hypothetical protein EJ04DRAFT_599125 [Polyplosphaeria fusca]|uniref:Uncharacterized protein n=1 Tax=Polyplosphaeria fusca TaxID=682080 RepID=A0A9P4UTW9_9PLEO|nr:hypothetical protein EJ04DRAFT_599125 [Polyplosphaeria fusca]